jgi:hypothetical protein
VKICLTCEQIVHTTEKKRDGYLGFNLHFNEPLLDNFLCIGVAPLLTGRERGERCEGQQEVITRPSHNLQ